MRHSISFAYSVIEENTLISWLYALCSNLFHFHIPVKDGDNHNYLFILLPILPFIIFIGLLSPF